MPSKIFSLGIPFEIQYCIEELIFKSWKYPDSFREENKGEFGPVNAGNTIGMNDNHMS